MALGRRCSVKGGAHTCHFRHAGLYDGKPLTAASSVVKIYRTCAFRSRGARCGRSLTGYVCSGN